MSSLKATNVKNYDILTHLTTRRLTHHMSIYVKSIRQTLNEICYTSSLDEYSFIMISEFLDSSKFHSRAWLYGESSPITCHPFLHPPLAQISISRSLTHTHTNTPALTTNLLPHPLQTALCPPFQTRIHTPGYSLGRETQVGDPHGPWKWTQGVWGTKFLGANNSECDLEGVRIPGGPVKL